jgi:hypothetical protein
MVPWIYLWGPVEDSFLQAKASLIPKKDEDSGPQVQISLDEAANIPWETPDRSRPRYSMFSCFMVQEESTQEKWWAVFPCVALKGRASRNVCRQEQGPGASDASADTADNLDSPKMPPCGSSVHRGVLEPPLSPCFPQGVALGSLFSYKKSMEGQKWE